MGGFIEWVHRSFLIDFCTGMGGMGGPPGGLIKYGGLIKASMPAHNAGPYSANSGIYHHFCFFEFLYDLTRY